MRSLVLAVALSVALPAMRAPAFAEPLFLRIRPNDPASGEAHASTEPSEAAQALALREAVWRRADRRARIAIASVCTGCMKPLSAFAVPGPRRERTAADLSAAGPIEATALESGTDLVPNEPMPPALLAEAGDP